MKIRELLTEMPKPEERKHIKSHGWRGPREIAEWLKSKGFKKLGSGAYSVAYARARSNKVVKFSKYEDYCYLKFAKYVKGKRSRHLPRIYDIVEYETPRGEKLFVTILEKLKPVKFDQIDWTGQNRGTLAWLVNESVIYNVRTKSQMEEIADILDFEYEDSEDFWNQIAKKARQFERSNKSFANMYRDLKRKVGKKCFVDIHDGNVFYRQSTNSFVFMDPYA